MFKVMKYLVILIVAVLLSIVIALLSMARVADAPIVPDAVKVKILTIQRDQASLNVEYQGLLKRMTELQQNFQKSQGDLTAAQEEAYTAAKVDKKDWSLDMSKLVFVAVPKPAPAPEKKP